MNQEMPLLHFVIDSIFIKGNNFISLLLFLFAGVLADATGSYDIPFYLAGACFILCSLLIAAFPAIKFLKQRQTTKTDQYMYVPS